MGRTIARRGVGKLASGLGHAILVLGAVGCGMGRTGALDEAPISETGVAAVMTGLPMTLGVLTELSWVLAEPDAQSTCPAVQEEGDQVLIDFGLACTPDTELSQAPLSGSAAITIPADSSLAFGNLIDLGYEGTPISGTLTGDIVRSGTTLRADLTADDISWNSGTDVALSGLFEIDHTPDGTSLRLSGGSFAYTESAVYQVWTEDVFVTPGSFSGCYLAQEGTVNILRETESATWTYTNEAAENGGLRVSFSDRDAEDLTPCQQ